MTSARPRFDAERAKAAASRIKYNEIRDALEGVRVRAVSADRTFSIEMGPGGAVLGIDFTDDALRQTPDSLARALVATINSGMAQIAAITNEVVAPYLSSNDLDLAAITTGRLPAATRPPVKSDLDMEIEAASAIPKRPLGRYARQSDGEDDHG